MKAFRICFFVFLFSIYINSSKAENISDFQIGGLSLNDSLLNIFTEKEIKKAKRKTSFKSKKYLMYTFFGDYNPSGKLTASWPRNVGQIPVYHSMKNTGRPAPGPEFEKFKSQYLDSPNAPLLPFGYGLSYTSFEYKNLSLAKKEINQDESLEIQVDVTNTGDRDGEEVVQLYLHDKVRSLTPPVRTLKGFEKVFLKKGIAIT